MSKNKKTEDMSIAEAAAYLGYANIQTLYQMRHKGTGPKSTRKEIRGLGRGPTLRVVYAKADLDAWKNSRKQKAKSKPSARGRNTTKKAA